MYQSIRSTIVPMRSETSATKSLGSQRSHLILLAMAGFFTVALATAQADPSFISAFASGTTLTIKGDLAKKDGSKPLGVTFNNLPLPITSSSSTMLTATLPTGLQPGSYHVM